MTLDSSLGLTVLKSEPRNNLKYLNKHQLTFDLLIYLKQLVCILLEKQNDTTKLKPKIVLNYLFLFYINQHCID